MTERDSSSKTAESSVSSDDLTFTRRTALALLGVGGLGAAMSGNAAAESDRGRGHDRGGHGTQTRKWNQDIDARGHDLSNLGSIEVDDVYTAARDADVVVWKDSDGVFHADGRDGQVASGDDVLTVTQAAVDSLTDGRTSKEKVVVVSPGVATGETSMIDLPSYTVLDIPVEIHVPYPSSGRSADVSYVVHADGSDHIEVPHLNVTGAPFMAMRISHASDVKLGHLRVVADEGTDMNDAIRIDGRGDGPRTTDVRVDSVYAVNANHHGFETYSVDRIQVGQVLGKDLAGCAVLLNDTTDATVGQVVGKSIDPTGHYAAFRVANYAHDVTVGRVVARACGRGVFGVSGCSDITVGQVNLVDSVAHGALIQDCQNFSIEGGVIKNSGAEGIRIDSRDAGGIPDDPRNFASTDGVTVTNLRIVDSRDDPQMPWGIRETGPDTTTSRIIDNDVRGSGTEGGISVFSPESVVRDNVGDGLSAGTVTLTSGSDPAARVTGVGDHVESALALRARPADSASGSFAWDHYFAWDDANDQWDLVFEWKQDPGTDLTLDYVVDQVSGYVNPTA